MPIVIAVTKTHPHLHILLARLVVFVAQSFVGLLEEAHYTISSDGVVCGGVALEDREGQCEVMLSLFVVIPLSDLGVIRNCSSGLVVRGSGR